MHRDQLNVVLVWVTHFGQNLSETYKRYIVFVDVALINLIGDNHDFVSMADLDDFFNVVSSQNLSGWVSRINDDHSSQINS